MNRNTSNEITSTSKSAFEAIRDNVYLKASGIALAAGALTACATNAETPQAQPETITTEVTPTPEATVTPSPETGKLTIEQVEIPSGLESDELGKVVLDRLDDWANAGADDSLKTKVEGIGWDALFAQVTEENTSIYAPALFVDGWENDPDLSHIATSMTTTNLGTLQWYAQTAWSGDPANEEAFETELKPVSVTEVSNDGSNRTLALKYQNESNSDKNLGPDISIDKGVITVSLTSVEGKDKVTALNWDVQP